MLGECPAIPLIPIREPARSRQFYAEVLGLRFVADDGFALVFECAGQLLRLTKVEAFEPQEFSILTWRVPEIAAAVEALEGRGVEFLRYPCFEQDALGIWTAPGEVAKIAWFRDPDGNGLSLVESRGYY